MVARALAAHAARCFPEECCGILLGRQTPAGPVVQRAIEAENIAQHDRARSYQIDWNTLLSVMRRVRTGSIDLIGFYHSHPDGSDSPSPRDRKDAWIGFSYVIIAVTDGKPAAPTSWRVPAEDAPFQRETFIESTPGGAR